MHAQFLAAIVIPSPLCSHAHSPDTLPVSLACRRRAAITDDVSVIFDDTTVRRCLPSTSELATDTQARHRHRRAHPRPPPSPR